MTERMCDSCRLNPAEKRVTVDAKATGVCGYPSPARYEIKLLCANCAHNTAQREGFHGAAVTVEPWSQAQVDRESIIGGLIAALILVAVFVVRAVTA